MNGSTLDRANRTVWRFARKVPFTKTPLLILNSYVWMGDSRALTQFAPFSLYLHRVFWKALLLLGISYALVWVGVHFCVVKSEALNTLDVSIQLFPNVLGFGIGAYALLFALPDRLIRDLERKKQVEKRQVGAYGLNAIMAFPLMAIALIIVMSAILRAVTMPNIHSGSLGLFFILYGMLLTMELVGVLFVSARKVIRGTLADKSDDEKKSLAGDSTE